MVSEPMMRTFEWNALRIGDRVSVHDDHDARLRLHDGTVTGVDVRDGSANLVAVRFDDRSRPVEQPQRLAVHRLPLEHSMSCWRCDAVNPPPPPRARTGRAGRATR